jgi:hypothetical protein
MLLTFASGAASAANSSPEARERADINRQQRELKARFDSEERACRQQFVVTACVDSVRSRRREALAPLRNEELRLDEVQRQRQAAARSAAIADKQRALAERGAEPPPVALAASRAPGMAPRSPWRNAVAKPPDRDEEAAAAAARVQASARRKIQADQAQERIARRQAEQAKKGKAAAPLPPPSAPVPGGR